MIICSAKVMQIANIAKLKYKRTFAFLRAELCAEVEVGFGQLGANRHYGKRYGECDCGCERYGYRHRAEVRSQGFMHAVEHHDVRQIHGVAYDRRAANHAANKARGVELHTAYQPE